MHKSVESIWWEFISRYEMDRGVITWMYLDTHRDKEGNLDPWPTTGNGNLIGGSTGLFSWALALPWKRQDGSYAREFEITGEFENLKYLKLRGDGYAYQEHASLFIDVDEVKKMVREKLISNNKILVGLFPEFESWPADAQLAIHNMSWLMGPNFVNANGGWPNLKRNLLEGNFTGAAQNCNVKNSGAARNAYNKASLLMSGRVVAGDSERKWLYIDSKVAPICRFYSGLAIPELLISKFSENKGIDCAYVQRALTNLGLYKSRIDGDFGPVSKAAFARYTGDTKTSSTVQTLTNLMAEAKMWLNVR